MPTPRTLHAVGPRPAPTGPPVGTDGVRPPARPPRPEPLLRRALGDLLRRERQRQGLSLRQLAAASRVSLAFLSEVERGRKEPSSEVLAAICRALGVPLVDLVGALHAELGGAPRPGRSSAAGRGAGGVQLAA